MSSMPRDSSSRADAFPSAELSQQQPVVYLVAIDKETRRSNQLYLVQIKCCNCPTLPAQDTMLLQSERSVAAH